MKNMTKIALLLLAVAAGSGVLAQTTKNLSPGKSYTFTATAASGSGTITYQWLRDGQPISGATSQNYTLPDYLAHGINVEFKRTAISSTCSNVTGSTNSYIITFCDGVAVCGICWAKANVHDYQTFSSQPYDYTNFYKWNSSRAWTAGSVSGWSNSYSTSATWSVNPCPAGWRLPTQAEFQMLHDGSSPVGGTWTAFIANGTTLTGRFYGLNSAGCDINNMVNCIFLPAEGFLSNDVGALNNLLLAGYYWSSTQYNTDIGYVLSFSTATSSPSDAYTKSFGFNVRCVQ